MGIMDGKRILITGISNKLSIAYGIAKVMHKQGAKLAFTYQENKLKSKIENITKDFDTNIILQCDVTSDEHIEILFTTLTQKWSKFDGFVHSIAYAPTDQLNGNFIDVITRKGFIIAHDISSYSFVALAKACQNILNPNASLVTLTYLGAKRVIPNYNVMGLAKASLEANIRYMANALGPKNIRVNGISAGPVKTLAACGIKNFRKMLLCHKLTTPLRRNITTEDIGNSAAFLCSDLSLGITGEILHVDGGFNITAINSVE